MRLSTWPTDDGVGHLVILQHDAVPSATELSAWIDRARRRGFHTLRTGALFPDAARITLDAGFRPVDSLVLLHLDFDHLDLDRPDPADDFGGGTRLSRLWSRHHRAAAELDQEAFGTPWGNSARSLADIRRATPAHRARRVGSSRRLDAFAISGAGGRTGYVQRVAVRPDRRRAGLATELVADALDWMRSRQLTSALVNTGATNDAALALYERFGFRRLPERLTVAELSLGATP